MHNKSPSGVKYCPKCHREVYRLVEKDGAIQVIQGSRSLLNLGEGSNVSMGLQCPAGHSVKLVIGEPKKPEPEIDYDPFAPPSCQPSN